MKKIMILGCLTQSKTGNKSFGGAERNMAMLANSLAERGYDICLCSVEGSHLPYQLNSDVELLTSEVSYQNKFKTHGDIFVNTIKSIRNVQPDVIISFWPHPTFYALLFTKIKRIKMIYSERNDPSREYTGIARLIHTVISYFCNGYVFQNLGAQRYFPKQSIKNSTVIHNPLSFTKKDTPNKKRVVRNFKRIISVGRLTEQKNHSMLIGAFSKYNETHPDSILEIFGEGALYQDLKKQIKMLNMENKIILRGTTSQILEEIASSDMFVLTSKYEGMPNVLMEALALGVPVVSTDFSPGTVRELLTHGVNGLICDITESDLIDKMTMYDDESLVEQVSRNSIKIFETHSIEEITDQWERFLIETMNGH
ncbi:glycosyltransferase [Streptococcus suis]|uniref:glycosyltransferase n=1 Tax=Streptococcus suis TaxID=1307 RepID=UPI0038BAD5B7